MAKRGRKVTEDKMRRASRPTQPVAYIYIEESTACMDAWDEITQGKPRKVIHRRSTAREKEGK
jgi:hypothetical protein